MFGKKIFVCPLWHKIVLTAYFDQKNPARRLMILKRYQHIIQLYLPDLTGEIRTALSTELVRFPYVEEGYIKCE